ncbi:inhibitor of growth protein 3 isoform X1 [Galleria mellonella]|uniref:Inhibitor of growth protein n=1 Tax=Galleria mellonella TaxID=7137 RepID=A0A6J1WTZ9_GALME|nr:inhibitor of growth protein 3 isoform X1 [Galleria mellonella]
MLYLEDYLEMIEHLPQELRDRFTEMREMDLSVQNSMDTLEKRVRTLFGGCRRGEINTDQANTEFADIKHGYNKTLEEADEKVALANQMRDLVDRYLRRLDTELHKFKCELEADNKGITELLEKRSLDLDTNTNHTSTSNNNHYKENSRYRIRAEKRRDSWGTRESRAHATTGNLSRTDSAIQAALGRDSYSLGHAGSAIAAAASQAIAATQQMQQGRRTASLKASYEAVAGGELQHAHHLHHAAALAHHDHGHGVSSGHSQTTSVHGHHTTSHGHSNSSSSNKRQKQKKTNYSSSSSMSTHTQQSVAAASRSSSPTVVGNIVNNVAIEEPMEEEWTYDPNEPRYCICNQVSYGDMVACDNQDCPYEWFHYPCVGITAPPKGKWYCPQCQNLRRNRTHRKN